jgi:hypothetical protein
MVGSPAGDNSLSEQNPSDAFRQRITDWNANTVTITPGRQTLQGSIPERANTIEAACRALSAQGTEAAGAVLRTEYPFARAPFSIRRYGTRESLNLFMRDGFIDRYSGRRLIFPPVLRVLSMQVPEAFPHHPAWKTDVTHSAFAELSATVDHIKPVTLGGTDDESNLATTSMNRNFAKMNVTLEELGWQLHAPGQLSDWDGMLIWFVDFVATHPEVGQVASIKRWLPAARAALPALQLARAGTRTGGEMNRPDPSGQE